MLTAVPCPPRSSDFGTSYTKLTLQPGVTTVIDNFYICPTNKRKVRAGPEADAQTRAPRRPCHWLLLPLDSGERELSTPGLAGRPSQFRLHPLP